jgi:cation diffusion facilitator family transporter
VRRSPEQAMRLGILAIAANAVLAAVKVVVGLVGHSYALVADGIESAADLFTSMVTWAGFRLSLRPADANHPFGHGRIEALAGVLAGLALLAAAAVIAWHAAAEIRNPHHAPAWFTLPVLLAVVVVKEWLFRRIRSVGDELDSRALQGDAWHHRSDAITSAAAAVGIAVALAGGPGFEAADDWAALVACLVIVGNGCLLVKRALDDVLDAKVGGGLEGEIRARAAAVEGVRGLEKCRIRKSGIGFFVELHVEVDPAITVAEGHAIGHAAKGRLMAEMPALLDVVMHIEPSRMPGART